MQRKTRRLLVVSMAVVAVGGVAVGGAALAGRGPTVPDSAPGVTAGSTSAVASPSRVSPATSTQPAVETPSASATPPADAGTPAATPAGNAQVVLAYADWDATGHRIAAAGFVANVIETGGACTIAATRSGSTVEATKDAEADATTTNCGQLTLPGDQLGAGDWQVTLSYSSASRQGTSQSLTVTVPR